MNFWGGWGWGGKGHNTVYNRVHEGFGENLQLLRGHLTLFFLNLDYFQNRCCENTI